MLFPIGCSGYFREKKLRLLSSPPLRLPGPLPGPRWALSILIALVHVFLQSGCVRSAEYSAYTKSLMHRVEDITAQRGGLSLSEQELKELRVDTTYVVRGSLQVEEPVDTVALESLGVVIGSRIGRIWTASIPLEKLRPLGDVRGVRYIEVNPPVRQRP